MLIGAGMPSVLAEISFVTNKQEGAAAEDRAPTGSRSREALLDAVLRYQQSLKRRRDRGREDGNELRSRLPESRRVETSDGVGLTIVR